MARIAYRGAALAAAMVMAAAGEAAAAGKSGPLLEVGAEHSSYTRGHGAKSLLAARARLPLGRGSELVVGALTGERRTASGTLRGNAVSATLVHDLGGGLSSRTMFGGGDVGPLFARVTVGEELAWRSGSTEVRGGGRVSRFAGGVDVRSFHAGLAQELGPVGLDYSLAAYSAAGTMPRGIVHRLEAGIADPWGRTMLQLGQGSSLHEQDWREDKITGSFRSIGVKRKHKLTRGLALEVGGGWTAFERPSGRYGAAKVSAGLTLSR